MKGNWDILHSIVAGDEIYQVYRRHDGRMQARGGNLEIGGTYDTEEAALRRLYELNIKDGLHLWVCNYSVHKPDGVAWLVTAVYANRLREAEVMAMGFAVHKHGVPEEDIFLASIMVGDETSSLLFRHNVEDFRKDGG